MNVTNVNNYFYIIFGVGGARNPLVISVTGDLNPDAQRLEDVMAKFRKKPVVIEAVQWNGANLREVIAFTDGPPDMRSMHSNMKWEEYCDLVNRDGLKIFTLEGKMSANIGDWVIKGVRGEFYPCKPDIFEATYELVA
jgi:hypothetical protein